MLILAAWWHPILATLFAFLALILMGVILLQRGRGVGLAGAFGGAGASTAFGSKTGDFMTKATVVIAAVFMFYAVLCNYAFRPMKAGLPTAGPPVPGGTAPAGPGSETLPPGGQPVAPSGGQPAPVSGTPAPAPPAEQPAGGGAGAGGGGEGATGGSGGG